MPEQTDQKSGNNGPWSPLKTPIFALLWIAAVLSGIGTWMNEVAAGWVMTTLTDSVTLVALVQSLSMLPIFLFAILAGALGDIVDRRKLIASASLVMAGIAFSLGFIIEIGAITPLILLAFIFALGTAAAFMTPSWQALVPDLVPKGQLQAALALNSIGINIARAIGPALAGLLIVMAGLAWPFYANAATFIFVFAAILFWKQSRAENDRRLPPERPIGAIAAGLRYARHSKPLAAALKRSVLFFLFASAYWALLPLVAKELKGGGPQLFGYLTAAIGAGALAGAVLLPRIRARFEAGRVAQAGAFGSAVAIIFFSLARSPALALAASGIAGLSWISILTSLNISVQLSLPHWVRARGLSIFVVVFFGSMSAGSAVWGAVAEMVGIQTALQSAGALLVLSTLYAGRFPLVSAGDIDVTPSSYWPQPETCEGLDHSDGPVLVTRIYNVPHENNDAFLSLVSQLRSSRLRSGAYDWEIYRDAEKSNEFIECFWFGSWVSHLRQHERVTGDDRKLQEEIESLVAEEIRSNVRHWIKEY